MGERVRLTIEDGIAEARLDRADKHNALDRQTIDDIAATLAALAGDGSVRAVVLCGDGPSFCAGIDIAGFAAGPEAMEGLLERDPGDGLVLAQRVALGWRRLPVPVIAAVQGVCFGGGLQIALGADIRLLGADAKLSVMEIKWGIIPDMGITRTLPGLVRADVARELCFTGRVVGAEEAVQLGLGTRLVDDAHAAAMALAREIAAKSPDAIRAAKRLFEQTWPGDEAAGLELETALQKGLLFTPNQIEAVRANFEKREPRWVP